MSCEYATSGCNYPEGGCDGACARYSLQPGQRVEVNWGPRGWLPGAFEEYRRGEADEPDTRVRCKVKMDNGFACDGQGYAAECVLPAVSGHDCPDKDGRHTKSIHGGES